jgi:hypothetical protein
MAACALHGCVEIVDDDRCGQPGEVDPGQVPGADDTAQDGGGPVLSAAWNTAEPTPLRSCDSSTTAAEEAVAMVRPAPSPTMAIHVAVKTPPEPALVVAPRSRPAAKRVNPGLHDGLGPREPGDPVGQRDQAGSRGGHARNVHGRLL